MTKPTEHQYTWLNPLTVVFVSSILLYEAFSIYWSSISTRNFRYELLLLYPVSYPYDQILLYFERLKDPYTGHNWGWEFFACILLAVSLCVALFASVFSAKEIYRKISVRAGIALTLVWIAGAFLMLLANSL